MCLVVGLACSDGPGPAPTVQVGNSGAASTLYGVELVVTHDGVRQAHLLADSAYQFDTAQEWELFNLTVTFFSSTGVESSTLTADEGTYHMATENMEARNNVVGVTPDGKRLTTSVLEYRKLTHKLHGPAPFVFDEPGRHLVGQSFDSDPDFTNVTATQVSGTPGRADGRR